MGRRPGRRHVPCARPRHRGAARGGRGRQRGGRARRGRRGARRAARLGRDAAAAARRDPPQGVRADDAAGRVHRQADVGGERQVAARRPGRGGVRRRVLPLVRGRGRPHRGHLHAGAVRREPDPHAAPADRRVRPRHALELPGRDGHPQDRPRTRGRLHRGAQARRGDAADRAGHRRAAGRGGRPGRRHQRAHVPQVGGDGVGHAARPAGPQAVLHRVHRGRQDPAARGGRQRDQLLDGAGRQRAVHYLRRRGHPRGGGGRADREDAQRRRGLHRGQPVLRARGGGRRVHAGRSRRGWRH